MDEQVMPPVKENKKSKSRLIALLALVFVVALAAYVICIRNRTWDAATYIPKDVVGAVTVDLTYSQDKSAALDTIKTMFKEGGIKDPEGYFIKEINKTFKVDFKKDVISHLNGRGGAAILTNMTAMAPGMMAVLGTKSDGDAKTILATIQDKLKANKIQFNTMNYKGYDFYGIESAAPASPFGAGQVTYTYVGAVNSGVVYANSESAIKKVVDTVKGKSNLLDDENFVKMRQTGGSTYATLYFSGPGYYKMISPVLAMGMGMMGSGSNDAVKNLIENYVAFAGNARASADGLSLTAKYITKNPSPEFKQYPLDELASMAPKGAAFFVVNEDWNTVWGSFKNQLLSNSELKSQVSMSLAQVKIFYGFDPFADVMDRITMIGCYYLPKTVTAKNALPGDLVYVLKVDKPEMVKQSIQKIHALAVSSGNVTLKETAIAGQKVYVGPKNNGIQFCDMMIGDKVIILLTGSNIAESAKSAIMMAQGKSPDITSTAAYKTVKQKLPEKASTLMYGNAGIIINALKNDIPAKDRKLTEAIAKGSGVFAFTNKTGANEGEVQGVAPFGK